MPNQLLQQFVNGSSTGGPMLPVAVHPLISTGYSPIEPQDQFFYNWETWSLRSITGMHNTNPSKDDHLVTHKDIIKAFTASVTGSMSSHFFVVGGLLYQRRSFSSLTGTTTADYKSTNNIRDMGVFAISKRMYDTQIIPGSLTATVTGSNFETEDISGDYYDSGSGSLIKKNTGESIGVVLPDDGMFVVTSSNYREVATAVTAVKFKTRVMNTTLNVFCKLTADELNHTLNPTSFMQNSISGNGVDGIYQSYDNITRRSSLTGDTTKAIYRSDLVLSGTDFSPYITSVGLYNDDNDLMAIAKFTKPLKKPTDLPLTIKIQLDL